MRQLLNYEEGMDNSAGTYVMAYLAAGVITAVLVLVIKPEIVKMIKRFELEHGLNGDRWYHRLEEMFGSYYGFLGLSALAHILRAVVVQNYPHTDDYDDTPTGWKVFSRLFGLTYFQALASLALSGKNAWFAGVKTSNHTLVKWATRVIAFLFIILSVVALAIPEDSGIMLGVSLIIAAIPPLATGIMALYTENTTLQISEGRFFICVFSIAIIICGIWVMAWEDKCAQKNARCDEGCPFEDDLNHNFWFHVFYTISTCVLGKALVTLPGRPEKMRPRMATLSAPDVSNTSQRQNTTNPSFDKDPKPANPQETTSTPAAVPEPEPISVPTSEPASKPVNASNTEPTDSAEAASGNPGRLLEDSLLPKMYQLFTRADDGTINLADAGLTKDEIAAKVTVAELHKILTPIGGLDLSRIDKNKFKNMKGEKIPLEQVFAALDADSNDRVTCKEFLALITKAAPEVYSKFVEDSALRKIYDLFQRADSGAIDVADAELTLAEMKAHITIERLHEALAPVDGLDLRRVDPTFSGDNFSVTIEQVFAALDTDKSTTVTMTEFLKLLRKTSSKLQT